MDKEKSTDLSIVKSEFGETNDEQQDPSYEDGDGNGECAEDSEDGEPKKKRTKKGKVDHVNEIMVF